MSDENISEEKVRNQHLREINQTAHWAYLVAVLLGGLFLMVLFIAVLGAGGA
jgi:hypothetical protein